jgi:hypothetical protein
MKPADVFQQIPSMTTEQVRKLIKDKTSGEYNLVDVRQPDEYVANHLPGAKLMPLGELANRVSEIDFLGLYREMSGERGSVEIPVSLFFGTEPGAFMEGGVSVREALEWAKGKGVNDILDLAIGLESNAYDLYIKMERAMEDERARRVFRLLEKEEQSHLEGMTALLEKRRFSNDESS